MLYFDEVPVGYRSEVGSYKLTQEEIVSFAKVWDPQTFHIDEEAAKNSMFGGIVASSLHLFAIATRLFFDHKDEIQILAMLGKDQIRLHAPARPGDTVTYVTECIESKPSTSKPDRGVIVLSDLLSNQNGDQLMTQKVTLLVQRKQF